MERTGGGDAAGEKSGSGIANLAEMSKTYDSVCLVGGGKLLSVDVLWR